MCSKVKVNRLTYRNLVILQVYNQKYTTKKEQIIQYIFETLKEVEYELAKGKSEILFLNNLIEDIASQNYEIFIIKKKNSFYIGVFNEGEIIDTPMSNLRKRKKILH